MPDVDAEILRCSRHKPAGMSRTTAKFCNDPENLSGNRHLRHLLYFELSKVTDSKEPADEIAEK